MKSLARELENFSFVEREFKNGTRVSNKCGRDFLYFALNFYLPDKFNADAINPLAIDEQRLFGQPVPKWLAWTMIQFYNMPVYLRKQDLMLAINGKNINSFYSFVSASLFYGFKISYEEAMDSIEGLIDSNVACAVDISISKWAFGLLDHVMFVYGYDEDNLYVFDTHTVPGVKYERVREDIHLYRLPKSVISQNWSKFGRFWAVTLIK